MQSLSIITIIHMISKVPLLHELVKKMTIIGPNGVKKNDIDHWTKWGGIAFLQYCGFSKWVCVNSIQKCNCS